MGITWYIKDSIGRPPVNCNGKKPILILFPGLGGGHNNLYTHSVAKLALQEGYTVGVANFRCAEGIPITSYRVTCSTSHEDATEILEYVYQNYIVDKSTGLNKK